MPGSGEKICCIAMSSSSFDRTALAGRASARCQVGADCLANGLGDGDGIRCVGVDADGIGPDGDVVSSHSARLALGQSSQAPCGRIGWILVVMFARADEATLGIVIELGVVFGD